jgi:hypothetical protein
MSGARNSTTIASNRTHHHVLADEHKIRHHDSHGAEERLQTLGQLRATKITRVHCNERTASVIQAHLQQGPLCKAIELHKDSDNLGAMETKGEENDTAESTTYLISLNRALVSIGTDAV